MLKLLSIALLTAAPSVHAASLHCVADGLTNNIRAISAEVLADGKLKVETTVYEYVLPAIIVTGNLDQFEVMAPDYKNNSVGFGINHFTLKKISTHRYALVTETHCDPSYQEEKCNSSDIILSTETDQNVWCNLQK